MNTDMPAFTSRERTLIAKEIQFLEKLLNLLNVGKPAQDDGQPPHCGARA